MNRPERQKRKAPMECFTAGWVACILPSDVLASDANGSTGQVPVLLMLVVLVICVTVTLRLAYLSVGWLRDFASRRRAIRCEQEDAISVMTSVLHELIAERRDAKKRDANFRSSPVEFAYQDAASAPAPAVDDAKPKSPASEKPEPENVAAFFDAVVFPSRGGAIKAGDLYGIYAQRCAGEPVASQTFLKAAKRRLGDTKRMTIGGKPGRYYCGFAVRDGVLKVVKS
jgi:hypothetical protein